MDNATLGVKLAEYAGTLEREGASLYRVRAYRRAAEAVAAHPRPLAEVLAEHGRAGLGRLPGVGASLAYTIEHLLRTGELRALRPADGHHEPERLLTSLPGVGPVLAEELQDRLGIKTLPELERAEGEGRLRELRLGPKRLRGLRDALAARRGQAERPLPFPDEPSVAALLAADAEYRAEAERRRGRDRAGAALLPLWQGRRDGWRFRALFANSALAHRAGATRDWVVIRYTDGDRSGQRTVVTETRGDLRGRRVVRGREEACRAHYADAPPVVRQCGFRLL